MQFLLMCCFDEEKWESIPDAQRESIMKDYGELVNNLAASGRYLAGARLASVTKAATLRAVDGRPAVVDGPFAETKEQLGGYHLIECSDRGEAIAIAKRIPTIAFGGAVEVRPLLPVPAA